MAVLYGFIEAADGNGIVKLPTSVHVAGSITLIKVLLPFSSIQRYALFPLREIFFSTHVLEVAEKLCDKVAIIKNGVLIRSGTMDEVKGDTSLEDVFLELEGEKC